MRHLTALAVLAFSALAFSEAAVYIGGGCYDCNPPGGQGPGVYTGVNGGRGGGGGGGSYYNNGGGGGGGGGRPVYSGNFGPGYSNGGGRGGGGGGGGGYGGGGYDDGGITQIIRG
uniref:Ctenidin-1 n=1 Tax=Drosophila rhopaloa TaxID=1041015 RepID=A0A6P4FNI2_DRORH